MLSQFAIISDRSDFSIYAQQVEMATRVKSIVSNHQGRDAIFQWRNTPSESLVPESYIRWFDIVKF